MTLELEVIVEVCLRLANPINKVFGRLFVGIT